jgi:hypothetical protein
VMPATERVHVGRPPRPFDSARNVAASDLLLCLCFVGGARAGEA